MGAHVCGDTIRQGMNIWREFYLWKNELSYNYLSTQGIDAQVAGGASSAI